MTSPRHSFRIAVAAAATVGLLSQVRGDALDPFGSTQSFETAAPKGKSYSDGDHGVDEQRGAATYAFPIEVPPGRQGMAPSLALSYSSQAPLRGGVAVGWSLDLPMIEQDPTAGAGNVRYRVGSSRLVEVPDVGAGAGVRTFRAQFDASFTRYEKVGGVDTDHWIARRADGSKLEFRHQAYGRQWRITAQIDAFGNRIDYDWGSSAISTGAYTGWELKEILYSANPAAGIEAHAKVSFTYAGVETCSGSSVPIGAELDFVGTHGVLASPRRLVKVMTWVRDTPSTAWRWVRDVQLSYDDTALVPSCNGAASPLRYLTKILVVGQSAAGAQLSAPPITFSYGAKARSFASQDTPITGATGEQGYAGDAPGTTQTLQDMDGDGRDDLVWIEERWNANQDRTVCTLVWKRGLSTGAFDTAKQTDELPTADWMGDSLPAGSGLPAGNTPNKSVPYLERCTLNGQYFARFEKTATSCGDRNLTQKSVLGYHFVDWNGDGRTDLLTNLWKAGKFNPETNLYKGGAPITCEEVPGSHSHSVDDGFGGKVCACDSGYEKDADGQCVEQVSDIGQVDQPVQAADGPVEARGPSSNATCAAEDPYPEFVIAGNRQLHIWRVFTGTGSGFNGSMVKVKSPLELPLPGTEGDYAISRSNQPQTLQTIEDLDGDGWLDVVATPETVRCNNDGECGAPGLGASEFLMIMKGRGGETLGERHWDKRLMTLSPPQNFKPNWQDYVADNNTVVNTKLTATLRDMNGDGRPDLVVGLGSLGYYPNAGDEFLDDLVQMGGTAPVEGNEIKVTGWWNGKPAIALKVATSRLLDVDGDGRADLVTFPAGGAPRVRWNLGDKFSALEVTLGAEWLRARRQLKNTGGVWRVQSDFTDVNGDGLPDLADWSSGSLNFRAADSGVAAGAAPPRLLRDIDNGRGMKIVFDYRSSNDPAARDGISGFFSTVDPDTGMTITSYLEPAWHMPSPTWVVSAVRVTPGQGQPELRTDYRYAEPLVKRVMTSGTDVNRPASFLGFQRVHSWGAVPHGATHGAETVHLYKYMDDGRGYLTQSETYRYDGEVKQLHALDTHGWTSEPLFNTAVWFVRATSSRTRLCDPGATVTSCAASVHWRDSWSTWQPYTYAGKTVLHVQTGSYQAASDGAGARRSTTAYEYRYTAGDYRVLPTDEETIHVTAAEPLPTERLTSRVKTIYNAAGLPVESRSWYGAASNQYVRTIRTFDAATGNLLTVKRPEQVRRGSALVATNEYGAYKLHAVNQLNELGQKVVTTVDLGTGAVTKQQGPNFRWVIPSSCFPACMISLRYDEDLFVLDPFGRATEHWATYYFAGASDVAVKLATTTFDDAGGKITEQTLRDPADATPLWITSESRFDGLGRILSRTDQRSSPGVTLPPAVTSYEYDASGAMKLMWVPNPIADGLGQVAYEWQRDSLGRVTRFKRPDAAGTGTLVQYDVQKRTVIENTGDASGNTTTGYFDMDGRLVDLEEHDNPNPGDHAFWHYEYDDFDRLSEVHAPDSSTWLTHDLLGRRTQIQREGRIWRYEYDHDGNVTAEISPLPAGVTIDANYRSRNEYDALGRLVMRQPAVRAQSLPTRQAQWIGPTYYFYDEGVNGVGQLTRVEQHRDPGNITVTAPSTPPYVKATFAYEANGRVAIEQRQFNPAGAATPLLTEQVTRTYNALGGVTRSTWQEGATVWGIWSTSYDARGLPQTVDYQATAGGTSWRVADYGTRSLGGAVRTRKTGATTQFGGIQRDWTYDVYGRATSDVIKTAATTYAQRTYVFNGGGDVLSVNGTTRKPVGGDALLSMSYTYDKRHRLLGASGGGYSTTMKYTATGNILRAKVSGLSLDARQNRDVEYQYGQVDPQAVDQLVTVVNGAATTTPWAQLTYDVAGNVTRRSWPLGVPTDFTWDGDDQLRVTAGADGNEAYQYDWSGQRAWAKDLGSGALRIWMGEAEIDIPASGVVANATRYLHLSDAGGVLARAEKIGTAAATLELQFGDALQNLMLAVKSGSAPVVSAYFHYGAFGEVIAQAGEGTHRREFNGKENDKASGLRYYGARYYDPLIMRWTGADPLFRSMPELGLGSSREANLYVFSGSNPVRYFDPDGRKLDIASPEEKDPCRQASNPGQCRRDKEASDRRTAVAIFEGAAGAIVTGIGCMLGCTDAQTPESEEDVRPAGGWKHEAILYGGIALGAGLGKLLGAAKIGGLADDAVEGGAQKAGQTAGDLIPPAAEAPFEIVPGSNGAMLKQATGYVKRMPGTGAQKADLFEGLVPQIERLSGGSWTATRGVGADGSHVFLGGAGEALVINPGGQLFRGSLQTGGVSFGGPSGFIVDFSKLMEI